MTISADTVIGFGGDGLPDTDWLGCHERAARKRGDIAHADAFVWMIAQFHRHVRLISDVADDADPDAFARQSTRVGGYRLFEFSVAREEVRTARVAQRQLVERFRAGNAEPPGAGRAAGSTYEEVAKGEIHTCLSNFLCVTRFADELNSADPLRRWIDTVPAQLPEQLRTFAASYLETLRGIMDLPSHDAALRNHLRALREAHDAADTCFDAAAGRAHAWRVAMFEARTASARDQLNPSET